MASGRDRQPDDKPIGHRYPVIASVVSAASAVCMAALVCIEKLPKLLEGLTSMQVAVTALIFSLVSIGGLAWVALRRPPVEKKRRRR